MHINPPLKDELISNFGLLYQIHKRLAESLVLIVVPFVFPPFNFSFKKASMDRRGLTSRAGSEGGIAPRQAFCSGPQNTCFLQCQFGVFFCRIGCPRDPGM